MSIAKPVKVLGIFARDWRNFPLSFNLLLAFGAIFVMSMVTGARQPSSVAVMCIALLAAYLAVLLPQRWLFALSRNDVEAMIELASTLAKHDLLRGYATHSTYSLTRSKKQEARSKKQEARSKKQEARSKKQEASFDTLVLIGDRG